MAVRVIACGREYDNRTLDDVLREKDARIDALVAALAESKRITEWAFRELREMADRTHEDAWRMAAFINGVKA